MVAKVSGIREDKLEKDYRAACQADQFGMECGPAQDELIQEEWEVEEDQNECMKLLNAMQSEARCLNAEDQGEDPQHLDEVENPAEAGLPDKADIEKILGPEGSADAPEAGDASLPATLLDCVNRPGDFFNAMFRLSVKLRSVPGGCDTQWIPNPRNTRKASKSLNWHHCLV